MDFSNVTKIAKIRLWNKKKGIKFYSCSFKNITLFRENFESSQSIDNQLFDSKMYHENITVLSRDIFIMWLVKFQSKNSKLPDS